MHGNSTITCIAYNSTRHLQKKKSRKHYSRAAYSFITATCTPDDDQLGRNM
jgi:hypothetical protein